MAAEGSGDVFVADRDSHTIRVITAAGTVSTLAGLAGQWGAADGTGPAARFHSPYGLSMAPSGDLFVVDTGNCTVRKLTLAGVVSTLAGSAGRTGAVDGPGAVASFNSPRGIAMDAFANAYVADRENHTIRKITPAGVVSTFAGTPGESGSADGVGASARFNRPVGLAVNGNGTVYVADSANFTLRRISLEGVVSTVAGVPGQLGNPCIPPLPPAQPLLGSPGAVAISPGGTIYVTDPGNNVLLSVAAVGGMAMCLDGAPGGPPPAICTPPATTRLVSPLGVAAGADGAVYIADTEDHRIKKLAGATATMVGTVCSAGLTDGPGASAQFSHPSGLALDEMNNLYVADTGNSVIRLISPASVVSTVIGSAGSIGSVPGPLPASLREPHAVAVSPVTGSLYIVVDSAVLVAADPIAISPETATAASWVPLAFAARGGVGAYTWSLAVNNSGGSIGEYGIYTAGPAGGVVDTVMVTDSLGATATATIAVDGVGQCQCVGTGPGGTAVTVDCGESACGSDHHTYLCEVSGWIWTAEACEVSVDGGAACQCNGVGPGGAPVTAECGQTACGSDYTVYSCDSAGWAWTGQACGEQSDAGVTDGAACSCVGTGPGGVSVAVDCGQSACGSDNTLYACGAAGWFYTGELCSGQTDASTNPCECAGTGPEGPVAVVCGESACGSDYTLYACSAAGWSYTGEPCGGQTDAGTSPCECVGTGPAGPVTAACGESACGSDYALYACSAAGWSYTGEPCGDQTDAGPCECVGTGPDGPVTVACGQSACGQDFIIYACAASGWSWTGQPCSGVIDFEGGATIHVPISLAPLMVTGTCYTSCVALASKVNLLPMGTEFLFADTTPGIACVDHRWTYWISAPSQGLSGPGWTSSGYDQVDIWLWDRGCSFIPPTHVLNPPPDYLDFEDRKQVWVSTP